MGRFLGQHFLASGKYLGRIARAIAPRKGECIIEIGPGHGELTRFLETADLVLCERDQRFREPLSGRFPKAKIISDDFRSISLDKFTRYKLVGNIPYYLTGIVFRKVLGARRPPAVLVVTVQREVAEKILADPPRATFLSIAFSLLGRRERVCNIPARAFRPPPRVDSAAIRITFFPKQRPAAYRERALRVIREGFAHPRKTLRNNFRESPSMLRLLSKRGLLGKRPGEISFEDWKTMICAAHRRCLTRAACQTLKTLIQ